jgi:hypothetical protein
MVQQNAREFPVNPEKAQRLADAIANYKSLSNPTADDETRLLATLDPDQYDAFYGIIKSDR